MRLRLSRNSISVTPETVQDTVFIEEVLKLKKHGDRVHCVRKNAFNLDCIAELVISARECKDVCGGD